MNIRHSAVLALLGLLPLSGAVAQSFFEVPTAVIITDDFSPIDSNWTPVTGNWTVSAGTYGDTLAGESDITVITHYPGLSPGDPGDTALRQKDFTVRARVRNQAPGPTGDAGVVYGYQDSQNYYEAVVAVTGDAEVRSVVNGTVSVLGTL